MKVITKENKGFNYNYELTPMRRFYSWLDYAVPVAIITTLVCIVTATIVVLI